GVERGRAAGYPDLTGAPGDDAAAHAAVGWVAGGVEPLARVVVEARGGHHGQHPGHVRRVHALLAGHRVPAAVGQRGRHLGEILGVDVHRALLGVDVARLEGIGLDVAIGEHEHRDGLVALVGLRLRLEDRLVHLEFPAGEVTVILEDLVPDLVATGAAHHARGRDGARIYHGVHLGTL